MTVLIPNLLETGAALLAGGTIGAGFATVQNTARRRHERSEQLGAPKTGWTIMPGAGGRVALFLGALVLVQVICPLWFRAGTQWWVAAGVAGGYGLVLCLELRRRLRLSK